MMCEHFLQRILKTLPLTFSSAMEYLVEQLSQTIFIEASPRTLGWSERVPGRTFRCEIICNFQASRKKWRARAKSPAPPFRPPRGAFTLPGVCSKRHDHSQEVWD